MKKLVINFILIVILTVIGCNNKKDESKNINSSLTAGTITDSLLHISFLLPNGYERLDNLTLQEFEQQANKETKITRLFRIKVRNIFYNDSLKAMISVVELSARDSLKRMGFTDFITLYKNTFEFDMDKTNLKKDNFALNDLSIFSYTYLKKDYTLKKIFFKNNINKIVQFDFSAPKNAFSRELDKYETIIKSIRSFTW